METNSDPSKMKISEELDKEILYISEKIDNIESNNDKNHFLIVYNNLEKEIYNYIKGLGLNKQQKSYLKSFTKQTLYEKFMGCDIDNRRKIQKLINTNFEIFLGRVDQVDLKKYFKTDFTYFNLDVEKNNEEYMCNILKAMENSLISECKCFICNRLNINELPDFLMNNNYKILKEKIRKIWKINYEIPINNLRLHSKYEYILLKEKFYDLFNERLNLFDNNYFSEDLRYTLFSTLILSNVEFINSSFINLQILINKSYTYAVMMGLKNRYSDLGIFMDNAIAYDKNVLYSEIDKNFTYLKKLLKNESDKIDTEKYLLIIFSFSIILNNLMILDENESIAFIPELKCSARERQFLINFINYLERFVNNESATFSSMNINFMLENSIFSTLTKSYAKVLFDENNKIKISFDYSKIHENFENNLNPKLLENYNKFLEDEIIIVKDDETNLNKVKNRINNVFTFIKNKINNTQEDKKIKTKISNLKLTPFDPINISTHIYICISGNLIQDIKKEKIWIDLSLENSRNDFYFYDWQENIQNSLVKNIFTFIKNIKTNIHSLNQGREESNKNYFKKNKKLAKVYGKILAYIIASRTIFKFHTISLLGYSIGCKVIKNCLLELSNISKYTEDDMKDIIHNVVFIAGACKIQQVTNDSFNLVSGRIINCYSNHDKTLRTYNPDAIGLDNLYIDRVENLDLSNMKLDHYDYTKEINKIFNKLNIL